MKCIEDEIPFDVPDNWKWVRLSLLTSQIFAGGDKPVNFSKEKTEFYTIPIYSNGIENDGLYGYTDIPRVSERSLTISARGTIGFACVRTEPFVPIIRLLTIIPMRGIEIKFLKFVFQYFIESGKGSSIPQLTVPEVKPKLIPVPPFEEQKRIVDSIDSVLSLIEQIESHKQSLSSQIDNIKSKILDLAIRGKLVPQDPNDEPASILLERIRAEKEELIKQGKIKRDKKESVIFKGDDNSYYQDLPNCWSVCKLCEISYFERGITFPASAKETVPTDRNIACARTANVQDLFDISNLIYVDRSFMKDNPDKLLKVNDIIVSTANSLELVGKSCIVEKLLEKMTFGGFVTVVRGIGINHKYIHMCLKNKFLKGEFSYKSTQTTNIANISTKDLAETIIYLPPLAEQRRIVHTIEALFAQIDKIAEQIS